MLKELVEFLFQAGAKSTEYQLVTHPTDPDKRFVIGPSGVSEIDTPRVQPSGIDSCFSAEDFCTRLTGAVGFSDKIWYDESHAVCYSSDLHRIASVGVDFTPHPILTSALAFKQQKWLDQKAVNRLLRIDFCGLVESFVTARFKTLNWESAKRSRQIVAHGKSSLDAEVRSSVTTDEGEMPESFLVNAPLFADPQYARITLQVPFAVDLDTDQCRIGLVLMPGAVEAVVDAQRHSIEGFLSALEGEYELICGESKIGK